jgi:hypothetical protein
MYTLYCIATPRWQHCNQQNHLDVNKHGQIWWLRTFNIQSISYCVLQLIFSSGTVYAMELDLSGRGPPHQPDCSWFEYSSENVDYLKGDRLTDDNTGQIPFSQDLLWRVFWIAVKVVQVVQKSRLCCSRPQPGDPWGCCTIGPVSLGEGLAGRDVLVPSRTSDSCGGPGAVHADTVARCTVFPLTHWCGWPLD